MEKKISKYIEKWSQQGYPNGIPDDVPETLLSDNIAPSYRAIALAILKNDHNMISLGFSMGKSEWYDVLKKIELKDRGIKVSEQLYFDFYWRNL